MTSFAQHFPLSEFQAKSDRPLGATEQEYAAQLSQRLELIRHALGDLAIVLTSYLRVDSDTQHAEGTAIDARKPGSVSRQRLVEVVLALQHVGLTWGQFIIYLDDLHFHISLPTGQARQVVLIESSPGVYEPLTGAMLASVPAGVTAPAPAVNVALAIAGGVAAAVALRSLGGAE